MQTFEEFLQDIHADGYIGTDDDMSDKFNDWLGSRDVDEFIEYVDAYRNQTVEKLIEEIPRELKNPYDYLHPIETKDLKQQLRAKWLKE